MLCRETLELSMFINVSLIQITKQWLLDGFLLKEITSQRNSTEKNGENSFHGQAETSA